MLLFKTITLDRRFLVSLLILVLLASNTWMPIPVRVEKDLSTPFPCQSKGCGCVDAQQCWEDCCCHSDLEKLAWAENNGVTPPAWFTEKMKSASKVPEPAASKCCCCCSKGCCSEKSQLQSPKQPQTKRTAKVFIITKQQNRCRGMDANGVASFEILLGLPNPTPPSIPEAESPLFSTFSDHPQPATRWRDPRPS